MDVVCEVLSRSSATMRMRLGHLAIPVQREVALRISESENLEAAAVRAEEIDFLITQAWARWTSGDLPQEELNVEVYMSMYTHFLGACAPLSSVDWLHVFTHNSGLDDGFAEELFLKVHLWLQTTRASASEVSVEGPKPSVFACRCIDLLSNGSPGRRTVAFPVVE